MAARTNRITQNDKTRDKIKVSQIVNRLQNHIFGKVEMSPTQLKASEILLRKKLPDLAMVEHAGDVNHRYVVVGHPEAASTSEWQQQHAPTVQ